MEATKKYAKPEGWIGKKTGDTIWRKHKWLITMYDKNSGEMKSGKFSSIKEINEEYGLNLTNDIVYRLRTLKRVDTSKRNKGNSFLSRYGHIKIDKIDEWREGVSKKDTRQNTQAEIFCKE
jgi:hypothetical protein